MFDTSSIQITLYRSTIMKKLMEMVKKIAQTEAAVLITGESGVGKEFVAEQIHAYSQRSAGPLIKVNCPSLSEDLLESELFGHIEGAFTDAVRTRQGKIAAAWGGTIFFDEVADISPIVQAKLLMVLENQKYSPIGSEQVETANIRVIAASNKKLEHEVSVGEFREDLFYRLNIFPLTIPPLRNRKEDIPMLAEHFLKEIADKAGKNALRFSSEAFDHIMSHSWPGNIRELHNAIERAVVLCSTGTILPEHLLLIGDNLTKELYFSKTLKDALHLFKKHLIHSTLLENSWNQTKSAKILGIQRTYLSRLVKELEIERGRA